MKRRRGECTRSLWLNGSRFAFGGFDELTTYLRAEEILGGEIYTRPLGLPAALLYPRRAARSAAGCDLSTQRGRVHRRLDAAATSGKEAGARSCAVARSGVIARSGVRPYLEFLKWGLTPLYQIVSFAGFGWGLLSAADWRLN